MNQRNFRKIFTVYFIVFGLVIALFGAIISYNIQINDTQKLIAEQAESIAFINRTNILQPMVKQMEDIVTSISKSEDITKYAHFKEEDIRKHLESIFYAIVGTNNQIMQLRFLDKEGKEQVRVDRQTETSLPVIVKKENLQDKSDRDYFQIVSQMRKSELWYSKIDLNIENGKIEVPYRPTFRIAMPIFKEQKFEGMVIVNLLLNNLIKAIQTSSVFEHYIVDKDGYFIIHHNQYFSWNRYTGTNRDLKQDFSKDASLILKGKEKGEEFFAFSLDSIFKNQDNAKLILKPKTEYKTQLINEKIQSSLIVVALSIFLSILMALFASNNPSKLQKALLIANSELKKLSATDMLTQIYNRRKIEELLEIELTRAKRYQRDLSLIILDIDHFKHTNDNFGHNAGDVVLKQTVEVVKNTIRQNDLFGRWGGEEFIIICPETNIDEVFIVAQKVRKAIDDFKFDIIEHQTVSLGVAKFEKHNTRDELINNADKALYLSKEDGRNRVTIYS